MRDYAQIIPRLWTGKTGRAIRESGRDVQVLAFYLMTCPSSNMIGLYYLPLPTILHEMGIDNEGACKALRRVEEIDFALYSFDEEVVWVKEMARYQIGEELSAKDNRCKGVAREVAQFSKCCYYTNFLKRYGHPFHLIKHVREAEKEAEKSQAPYKPLARGEMKKPCDREEQEQEQEHEPPTGENVSASRNLEIQQAQKNSDLRRFATNWLSANHPNWLRKVGSLMEMLQALGKEAGIEAAELAIIESKGKNDIRDPFAYGLPAALKRANGTERHAVRPRSAIAAPGREDN